MTGERQEFEKWARDNPRSTPREAWQASRRATLGTVADKLREFKDCECGHNDDPKRFKYNTVSGHSIDCYWDLADSLVRGLQKDLL